MTPRRCFVRLPLVAVFAVALLVGHSIAQEPSPNPQPAIETPSPFDLPQLQALKLNSVKVVAVLLARGEYESAERVLEQTITRLPYDAP